MLLSDLIDEAIVATLATGRGRDGQLTDQRWPIDPFRTVHGEHARELEYWTAIGRLAKALGTTGPVFLDGRTYSLNCRNVLVVEPLQAANAHDARRVIVKEDHDAGTNQEAPGKQKL